MNVQGLVAPGFETARDVFRDNFISRGDTAAAFAVYVEGRRVVDLVGGDYPERGVQILRSASKAVVALLVHVLAERGVVDIDRPIADVWKEFGAAGKEKVSLRDVLTHRAGLPAVDVALTLEEALAWEPAARAVAAQRPLWEPGSRIAYHDLTFGWIIGETLRRITGRRVGALLQKEIALPLGLDLWIGVPRSEHARIQPLRAQPLDFGDASKVQDDRAAALAKALTDPTSLVRRVSFNPDTVVGETDSFYLASEVPSTNGVADARSLARLFAATIGAVDGVQLLPTSRLREVTALAAEGEDAVVGYFRRYALGFMLPDPTRPMAGTSSACFGHYGAGGTLVFADPEHGVAFAYATLEQQSHAGADPRSRLLAEATIECARAIR